MNELIREFSEDEFEEALSFLLKDEFMKSLLVKYYELDENGKNLFCDLSKIILNGIHQQPSDVLAEFKMLFSPHYDNGAGSG